MNLPVKNICQCQLVSKSWQTMIADSEFNHMVCQRNCPVSIFVKYVDFPQTVCIIHYSSDTSYSVEEFDLPSGFKEILGSCYGLICLGDEEQQKLLFLNPFTRWIQIIQELGDTSGNYGFGYDLTIEDFKLVKLLDNFSAPYDTRRVMIYSMKDHCWREKSYESWQFKLDPSAANFVADKLYWRGFLLKTPQQQVVEEDVLITFNICSETFGRVRLPEELCGRYVTFGVIENKLSACLSAQDISIWFLNDDQFQRSITLANYKANLHCLVRPLYLRGNTIFLLRAKRKITKYNITEDSKVQILGFNKTPVSLQALGFGLMSEPKARMEAIGFVQSLFPLVCQRNGKHDDEPSKEISKRRKLCPC
ncbi:putative F-box domain-containing protein [Rosa chinensis]|uniref:Putative F-box domain-containing protein n=1 Tax=Rosa chinensis TaxID=74649 RepID=A0A2P6PNX6_ROSCH|nr:F-box/kelch-repeat protein At3g23880 [Rosa chinensis]PRQ23643.1 putative F-box domain-containing protein [Rosa chinensis]